MSVRIFVAYGRRRGFTVVELLVVVAIAVVATVFLSAFMLPSVPRIAREPRREAICRANLRNLMSAWHAYVAMHATHLPPAWTGGESSWVGSGNTVEAIRGGSLYPYIQSAESYRCPADPSGHYRSYSVSDFVGGVSWCGLWTSARRVHEIPSVDTMVFVEEQDPRGYNMDSWAVHPKGDSWADWMPAWHDRGAMVAFADGHSESWRWQDERTWRITWFNEVTPDNPDLRRVQGAFLGRAE